MERTQTHREREREGGRQKERKENEKKRKKDGREGGPPHVLLMAHYPNQPLFS